MVAGEEEKQEFESLDPSQSAWANRAPLSPGAVNHRHMTLHPVESRKAEAVTLLSLPEASAGACQNLRSVTRSRSGNAYK